MSVEYALRDQQSMKQVKAAKSAGAACVLTLHDPPSDDALRTVTRWSPRRRRRSGIACSHDIGL